MIIKHIEERAESILKNHNLFTVGFSVNKLARQLGIGLVEKTFDKDISGLLAIGKNQAVISYNYLEDEKRQRFTIAHELGHYFLHSKDQPLFIDKPQRVMYRNNASATGEIQKEREANAFAAALLMPRKLIEDELDNSPDDTFDYVKYLAKRFKVSEQAMSFRLSNLGYYLE